MLAESKLFCLLLGWLAILTMSCQKNQASKDEGLGYRDYLKSHNFVYIHGETADSTQLEEDKYLEDNLDYVLKENEWVLVNFSAYWCKDCRKFDPSYREVAQLPRYKDITFAYAEVDGTKGNEKFRTRFALPGVPVTILFHQGEIPQKEGQPAILFGQRGDKAKSDLLALLEYFYQPN